MTHSDLIIFDSLIKKHGPAKKGDLIRFLSEDRRDYLSSTSFSSQDFNLNDFTYDTLIQEVHYSWFLKVLESFTKKQAAIFLLILPEETREEVQHLLNASVPKYTLSEMQRTFLKKELCSMLLKGKKEWIPAKYLPLSPMIDLLTLNKKQLIQLIDMLSMYDLALEIKQIVDTKLIKQIFELLTEEEKEFVQKIMNNKEPFSFPRIGLNHWDGLEHSLRSILHKRGIRRLSIAMLKEHSDFIWHICHKLDSGRGQILNKMQEDKVEESIIQSIQVNILELIATIRRT